MYTAGGAQGLAPLPLTKSTWKARYIQNLSAGAGFPHARVGSVEDALGKTVAPGWRNFSWTWASPADRSLCVIGRRETPFVKPTRIEILGDRAAVEGLPLILSPNPNLFVLLTQLAPGNICPRWA